MAKNKGFDQPLWKSSFAFVFHYAKGRFSHDMAQLMAYFAYFYIKTYVMGVKAKQMSTHNKDFYGELTKLVF